MGVLLLALLAYVLAVQYVPAVRAARRSFPRLKGRGPIEAMFNPGGRDRDRDRDADASAARLRPPHARGRAAGAVRWADQAYRTFHGRPATRVRRVRLPAPQAAVLLGDLKEFTYAPPATSKRGRTAKGEPIQLRHESGDVGLGPIRLGKKPKVYAGDDNSLLLLGGTQTFDAHRGVVG